MSTLKEKLARGGYVGAAVAAMLIVFGVKAPNFFSLITLRTVASQVPDGMILAVGMCLVLVAASIDLSVGSVLAFAGAVLGKVMVDFGGGAGVGVLAALALGLICGMLNGAVTVRWKLPAFIVTLGMLEVARGGAYLVTHSETRYIGEKIEWLSAAPGGVSLPFVLAVIIAIAAHGALTRTVWGRYLLAVGSNEAAAGYAGIRPERVRFTVFALSGLLSGVAAVVQTSRLGAADPNAGSGAELQAIAACVIGGTSLQGGRGSIPGAMVGVILISVLGAGLSQMGVQDPAKRIITGLVIVGAVILDRYREGR